MFNEKWQSFRKLLKPEDSYLTMFLLGGLLGLLIVFLVLAACIQYQKEMIDPFGLSQADLVLHAVALDCPPDWGKTHPDWGAEYAGTDEYGKKWICRVGHPNAFKIDLILSSLNNCKIYKYESKGFYTTKK